MNRPKNLTEPATASHVSADFSSSAVLSFSAATPSSCASRTHVLPCRSTVVPRGQLYTIQGISTASVTVSKNATTSSSVGWAYGGGMDAAPGAPMSRVGAASQVLSAG